MGKQPEQIARALASTGAVASATMVLVSLNVSATTAGLVFLTLVVWCATLAGWRLSSLVALLCAAGFDFFFLPPLHTFRIVGIQQWVAMASFVASSAVVSRVAERARQQKLKAEERRAEVEQLYALSQQMMLIEDAEQLLHDLPRLLDRIFNLSGAVLYVRESDEQYASVQDLPMGMHASLQATVASPQPVAVEAGGFTLMPLMLGLRPVGALAWRPTALGHDAATAVCAQVALAVARSLALETTARIEAAREAERLRTALTDSLTHELRTPLTAIRAASSTLVEAGSLDPELTHELATIIDEESARLDLLIGEAVEMAELDANPVSVNLEPHLVAQFLADAVEASTKNLTGHPVRVEVDETLVASFDARLLSRVLRHLLENAASHTPAGTRVRLGCQAQGERLTFEVEDSGPGIDPRDLPHIFDRFYRGKRRKAGGKGSGMGLAIVRSILKGHGGGVEAQSEPGHGARFRFWVPLEVNCPPDEATAADTARKQYARDDLS